MGQKVNPHGFRLGITTDFASRWFADSTKEGQRYRDYVAEDVAIRAAADQGPWTAPASATCDDRGAPATGSASTSTPRVRGIVVGRRGAGGRAHPRRPREAPRAGRFQLEHPRGAEPRGSTPSSSPRASPSGSPARVASRRAMQQGRPGRRRRPAPRCIRVQCLPVGSAVAQMTRSQFYREGRVPLHTLRAEHRLRLLRGPRHLRPHRREGLDLQGRRRRRPAREREADEADGQPPGPDRRRDRRD